MSRSPTSTPHPAGSQPSGPRGPSLASPVYIPGGRGREAQRTQGGTGLSHRSLCSRLFFVGLAHFFPGRPSGPHTPLLVQNKPTGLLCCTWRGPALAETTPSLQGDPAPGGNRPAAGRGLTNQGPPWPLLHGRKPATTKLGTVWGVEMGHRERLIAGMCSKTQGNPCAVRDAGRQET